MGNNIKGITVEIGGDTGPLNTALKGVNKTSGELQSELKEINRQLKFDPSNTELLTQKQTILAKEIESTKQKLSTLKEAQKEVEQQFQNGELGEEKYRAFQREVEKTESQLKSLEKQAKETSSVLGTQLENAGTKISAAGEKISGVGNKLLPVSGAIVGVGVAAAKAGADFEESASKVSTIADTSSVSMEKLKEGVLNLSTETGESADDLNEALYQTISAGVKTSDAVEFLGTATKLAKGGFTDSTTAIDALTTTINAYGLKASDAKSISDQLIQTQNLGKTTVAELGGAVGNVIPIAASMNVSTQDLFASLAELTKNGVKTDEAVTGVKSALSSILSPSTEASKAAQQMGIDFSEAHLKNVGWPAFLQEIQEKTGGSSEKLASLFGNVRALNAVTILSGKGSKDFSDILQQMGNAAGSTDTAFSKMEDNSASKWEKSMNTMKNAGINLGESLSPVMDKISEMIKSISDRLAGLSKDQVDMIVKVALVTAAVAPVLIIIGKLTVAIGNISTGIGRLIIATAKLHGWLSEKLPKAITFLATHPIVLVIAAVIAAIALLVIGIKHLWDTNEGFRKTVINAVNGIKSAWSGLASFFTGIPAWWSNLWNQVGQFFTNLWNGIISFFTTTIPQWVNSFIQWIQKLPYNIGYAIGTMLADIVNFGVSAWNWVTTQLPQIINGIVQWFQQLPGKIWAFLVDIVTKIGQWGTNMVQKAAVEIPLFISKVISFIQQLPGKIWAFLVDVVNKVVQWAANLVTTAGTEIPKFVSSVVSFISELPGKMLDIGKNIVTGIWDGINGAVSWLHDRISDFCSGIVDGFKKHLIIHSPSKLFADVVGKNIALGIGQGFTENMQSVIASMTAAIPTSFDTGVQVRTAMAAAYGGYSVQVPAGENRFGAVNPSVSSPVFNQTVNNYSPKAISPAESARLTRNATQQIVKRLR